jgi:hypothetical protein
MNTSSDIPVEVAEQHDSHVIDAVIAGVLPVFSDRQENFADFIEIVESLMEEVRPKQAR